MRLVLEFIWLGVKILLGFFLLASCGTCMFIFMLTIRIAQVTPPSNMPDNLKDVYGHRDIAELLFRDDIEQLSITQGLHGFPPGYDYTTECGDMLYSPLPGVGVVTFNAKDGYIGPYAKDRDGDGVNDENTQIEIEGDSGKVIVLHGKYKLVKPGDMVVGGVTPIGYNASEGNSTGCHAHISWEPNPNWNPILTNSEEKVVGDYSDIINKYSKIYDLDPRIVRGIIMQESVFNADAISSAGAVGLMQIMPITKQDQCPQADLHNPEQNIACGTKHLRWSIDNMGGDVRLGIMAYHSGVTNQKQRGATSLDLYYYDKIIEYSKQ